MRRGARRGGWAGRDADGSVRPGDTVFQTIEDDCLDEGVVPLLLIAGEGVLHEVVEDVPLEEVGSPKWFEDAVLEEDRSPKCAAIEGPAPDC